MKPKGPPNFGDLEEDFSTYDKSQAVVLPLSYEGTVTYGKGTSRGPQAIIQASRQLELYDEELDRETYRIGIHTLKTIDGNNLSPEKIFELTCQEVSRLIKDEKFVISLGGEHSLTLGPVKALREKHQDLSVLQLDAHADLRDEYEGTKYNHACIGRRILDLSIPLTQIGVRSLCREQQDYINNHQDKLKVFYAYQIAGRNDWIEKAISSLSPNVYLTLDLDVFDPSIMPAVGTPEPGGLGWYETLHLLRSLAEKKNIVGFDIMELAPQPGNIAPDFLAAKLVYKILGYIFQKQN